MNWVGPDPELVDKVTVLLHYIGVALKKRKNPTVFDLSEFKDAQTLAQILTQRLSEMAKL